MKALIFDPYFDTLGGGERYTLDFALALVELGYHTEIAWSTQSDLPSAAARYGIDYSSLTVNSEAYDLLSSKSGLLARFRFTRQYDLIFWVSDGSLPFLFAKKNLIHFQVPFTRIGGLRLINIVKSLLIHRFIYNSHFTQNIIAPQLPYSKGSVLYPPIAVTDFVPGKKAKIILSVARFDSPLHAKRQDVLIAAFKKFYRSDKEYKLVLAGGLKGGDDYLSTLKHSAAGLPVEFINNPDFNTLKKLYSQATFFWHAAGYEVNENVNPEKVEHFGMTTVEAMSAGCVPVVINKGGQKEIIIEGTGKLCKNPDELAATTLKIIDNPEKLKQISLAAQKRALDFSRDVFKQTIADLL